ncbi:MAG: peptidoglycan-binding protein [Clostridia bacterium]|nr:peptidoglycan-binding protein [Clostridia bacterium]
MVKRFLAVLLVLVMLAPFALTSSAFAAQTLRRGARGSAVMTLQTALKDLGYYTKAVDGIYGSGTVAAVRAFQAASGLKADGIAGPKTMAKLNEGGGAPAETQPAPVPGPDELRHGSRGEAVKALQSALKKLGYYTKTVDGIYGKGTASAVRAFQQAKGLDATGNADSRTQELISASAAQNQDQAQPAPAAAGSTGTLRLGDSGDAVLQMQERLAYIGYYSTDPAGVFDEATRAAVLAFQKAQGLTKDGLAGKKTLAALETAWKAAKKEALSMPDEAVTFLRTMAAESGAACGTVLLSKHGEPFLIWSFGGIDENTCLRIASVTKWVTAIGLMTLYDQGKLDLDADIGDYLPFKVRNPAWPERAITARMLLSHTSSLSPDADNYHPDWSKIGANGYDPIFSEFVEPGTQYAYADYNGALFGCLIEAITGESVQKYMDRTVFKPLGLTAAYTPKLLPSGTVTKDLLDKNGKTAISVKTDINRTFNNKADPKGNNGYTVGRLFINTDSLTRLAQMMLAGGELDGVRILNTDTVALMEADQPGLAESRYGLGTVRLTQFDRGTWYGHQGRYSGLSSNIYYQRETGITMALIMNGYDQKLEDNVVMPAVTLLRNMELLETLCTAAGT